LTNLDDFIEGDNNEQLDIDTGSDSWSFY
jgi:hypothetical protein